MASTLKLLTFNIAHGRGLSFYQGFHSPVGIRRNLDKIGALFRDMSPDVIALQEVDEDSHWNKNINLLEHLRRVGDYDHSCLGRTNLREGNKPLCYGNATLSRFPFHTWHSRNFVSTRRFEKGYLYTLIDTPQGVLPLINLHLDYAARIHRLQQAKDLLAFMRGEKDDPAPPSLPILCGDFNTGSRRTHDAIGYLFQHGLTAMGYRLFPENGKTFPAHLPWRGIDFILVPPDYRVIRCEVPAVRLSDHRPVLIELG